MTLALLFVVFFIGGPLAFRALIRGPSERALQIGAGATASIGLVLRYGFPDLFGRSFVLTALSVGLIWIAWIMVLAYGAIRLRQVDGGAVMRRWTGVIGAAGTTMPWFGLASANLLQG